MRRYTLAILVGLAALAAACGDDAATVQDTVEVEAEVLEPLPELTVAITSTRLTGNAPLEVGFTAVVTGADPEDLTITWSVDGAAVGEGPSFEFTFFRAGSATVVAEATFVRAADQATVSQSATAVVQVRACADLRFDRFTVDAPTELPPGGSLRVRVARLINDGDTIEDPFVVALALSSDAHLDLASDVVVAGPTFQSMTSGLASESAIDLAAQTFALPADLPEGDWFAFLVADPGGAVNECQEANNAQPATNNVRIDVDAGKLPNLVMPAIEVAPELVVSQGESLSYSFQIRNTGEADAKQFRHAFWLSSDAELSPEVDVVIAAADDESSRVQTMVAGFGLGFYKSWRVPDDIADGTYWIVGRVDATDAVGESDESDNVAASATSFTVRREVPVCADLALDGLVVSPLSSYWGGSVLLQARMKNPGSQPIPQGWLFRAYLSLQPTLNFSNAIVVGTWAMDGLAAGEDRVFEVLLPVSDDLPVVPHYVAAFADPTSALAECSEGNNARVFGEPLKIAASATVDVEVPRFDYHPSSVVAGQAIKVEYDVANRGTSAATAFQIAVVLSPDASITRAGIAAGVDIVIDRVTVPTLAPEELRTFIRDVVVPAGLDHAVSSYRVGVLADVDGFLTKDTSQANNVNVSDDPLTVTGATGGCFEDDLEDDDTRAVATLVGPATGIDTTDLGSCGDSDWFQIVVDQGHSLFVDVDARPIVTYPAVASGLAVELYDPAGNVTQRATLGPRYEVRAFAVPSLGTWAVRVVGATTAARASYDLDVAIAPPRQGIDLVGYDVRPAPATSYPGGRVAVAWREVNLGTEPAGARVTRIWLSKDRALDDDDLALGEVVAAALGPQATASLDAVVAVPASVPGGSWHLVVEVDADGDIGEADEEDNAAVGGPIVLDPLKVCSDDEREPNDEIGIASPLASGEAVTGAVVCPGLDDWYAVELAQGDALTVDLDYAYDPSKGKLVLQLWDPSGEAALLTESRTSSMRVALPSAWRAGRWLVRVANEPGGLSAPYVYELEAAVAPAPLAQRCLGDRYEDNNVQAAAIGIGCGLVAATLCNLDVDWYVIQGKAGQRLDIQMTHARSELYPKLFQPGGTSAVAQLWGGNGTLTYTPGGSGPLLLKVEPRSGPTSMTAFDYTVRVTGLDGADLSLAGLASDLGVVDSGEDVGLALSVANQCGADAGAFDVGAFLSIDDARGDDDVLLATWSLPGLAALGSEPIDAKVTVPWSTLPGLYWIVVQADAAEVVVEGNELDNALAVPLEVREPCDADPLEPNDARAAAVVMSAPATREDLTICPYDQDWFAVPAEAGERVTIEVRFEHAVGDLDVRVYAGAGLFPIAAGQSTDDDERVTIDVSLATTLYVRVAGHGPASAPYDLIVDVEP